MIASRKDVTALRMGIGWETRPDAWESDGWFRFPESQIVMKAAGAPAEAVWYEKPAPIMKDA